MTEQQVETSETGFSDRKTGLVGWGIFQIVLGGICILMMGLMIIAVTLGSLVAKTNADAEGFGLRMMVPGVLVYGLLGAWWITMGIGSVRCRRWAQAMILSSSWLWLVGGVMGMLFMLFAMPDMYASMSQSGQLPPGAVRAMKIGMMVFMALLYIILPGALLLFYRLPGVRETVEARDPEPRWTDRCPVPVLAICLLFWMWAGSPLFMASYNWAFPFFGTILSGAAGAAVVIVMSVLFLAVGLGMARLRIEAWWAALILAAAWGFSAALTFNRLPLIELYRKMNLPAQSIELMEQSGAASMSYMPAMMIMWGVCGLVFLGVMIHIRGYFKTPDDQQQA